MNDNNIEVIHIKNMEEYGFGPVTMKKIKVCPVCGHPSNRSKQFCTECGYQLSKKTLFDLYKERHRSCITCGTVLSNDMEFCPQCGKRI